LFPRKTIILALGMGAWHWLVSLWVKAIWGIPFQSREVLCISKNSSGE
jgi:hypothetical protein